jgi:signal transduction histidine kinase
MSARKTSAFEDSHLENSRLRGDLLTIGSRVSHDLRTPLGGILNSAELLKEILAEKSPGSAAFTNSIFDSVDELTRLIKSISLLAKATANPVPKKNVAMGEIVSAVSQRLESRLLKKHATMTAPDSWPEVEGAGDWLEFVWWNFLANAIQHGGQKIQLGWEREKNECKFWIRDDGKGVPPELRPKLFQPFDTLHKPGAARGISLSIVQRLMELQDGRCGYQAVPEGGSFFYFTLPAGETDIETKKSKLKSAETF